MRLATVAAICLSMVGLAATADAQAAFVKMPTNIPAQGLGPALKSLAKDRGFQVVFRSEVVGSAQTQGAFGNLTTPEALTELLKGTDLSYSYLDEKTVTIISRDSSQASDSPRSDQLQRPSSSKEGKNNSSQDFRVAQVDQTPAGPQAVGTDRNSEPKKQEGLTEIVVTGTHIHGVKETASSEFLITRDDMLKTGHSTLEDVFRDLPQNFGSTNSAASLADGNPSPTAQQNHFGSPAIDLRGLGPESTLVLLNGVRRAGGDYGRVVDLSTIPLAVIERAEVVTDGNSAIYGSDAIGGESHYAPGFSRR
jgi:iron complex outermembrane recepter protein